MVRIAAKMLTLNLGWATFQNVLVPWRDTALTLNVQTQKEAHRDGRRMQSCISNWLFPTWIL